MSKVKITTKRTKTELYVFYDGVLIYKRWLAQVRARGGQLFNQPNGY